MRVLLSAFYDSLNPSDHHSTWSNYIIRLECSHFYFAIPSFSLLRCAALCPAPRPVSIKSFTHTLIQCAYAPNKCFNDILCVLYYRLFIVDHMREGDAAAVTFHCRRKQLALAVYRTCSN